MTELGRILIADDEEAFLQMTATLFRQEGYECVCAPDGATAVQLLRSASYDLLITDINMPGNRRLELIHDLPSLAAGMPVIIVTAYPSLDSTIQLLHLSVVDYLVKPFGFGELLAAARKAITYVGVYRAVRGAHQQLQGWYQDLQRILQQGSTAPSNPAWAIEVFFAILLRHLGNCLADLEQLITTPAPPQEAHPSPHEGTQARRPTDGSKSTPGPGISLLHQVLQTLALKQPEADIQVGAQAGALPPELLAALRYLSSREQDVLRLLLANHRTRTIARTLCISLHTVRSHLKSIFSKLEVHSQIELLERCGYIPKQGEMGGEGLPHCMETFHSNWGLLREEHLL